jgi:hypothetical protein
MRSRPSYPLQTTTPRPTLAVARATPRPTARVGLGVARATAREQARATIDGLSQFFVRDGCR